MPGKSVAAKGHIKPGMTIAVVNGIPAIVKALGLPDDVKTAPRTRADVVLLFVKEPRRAREADANRGAATCR